jgi:hypothetical protein
MRSDTQKRLEAERALANGRTLQTPFLKKQATKVQRFERHLAWLETEVRNGRVGVAAAALNF